MLGKLSQDNAVFYPFAFRDWREMRDFSRKKEELEAVFALLDVRKASLVNAHEFIAFAQAVVRGSLADFLAHVVLNHAFVEKGALSREEFFYFLDCFFRAAPKLLLAEGRPFAESAEWRLTAQQLETASRAVFSAQSLTKEEFSKAVMESDDVVICTFKALWAKANETV